MQLIHVVVHISISTTLPLRSARVRGAELIQSWGSWLVNSGMGLKPLSMRGSWLHERAVPNTSRANVKIAKRKDLAGDAHEIP